MSEAPERVWLHNFDLKQFSEFMTNVFDADIYSEKHDECTEYVRADIAKSEKNAAVREVLEEVKAFVQPRSGGLSLEVEELIDQLLNEAQQ